ncbi:MAG TPA: tetratricopeptide repeat protein, partial [Lautropia sp.]|nr:tetratricopeptide repeat protein [Lautropia sp.]
MPPPRLPPPRATDPFEEARSHFLEGLDCLERSRFEDAEQCFLASLSLQPGRISTLINLAATRLELARPVEALAVADEVIALEGDNIDAWFHRGTALGLLNRTQEALAAFDKVIAIDGELAEPWLRRAQVLQSLNRPEEALGSYDRALAIDPALAQGWSNRGGILQEMRRLEEAAHSFREALRHGGDRELNEYYLAAVGGGPSPGTAPQGYVRSLFDDYADQFDEHLVKVLNYRAHTVLVERLNTVAPKHFTSALDLGCGTGLCGALVSSRVDRLTGVDLSGEMLAKARQLGVYQRLVQADIAQFLQAAEEPYDLVLAADVFIYVGDLASIFGRVRQAMSPGGWFCFTAEVASTQAHDFELLPSLRYAHSEDSLRKLADLHGFNVVQVLREALREDQLETVSGLYLYLTL